MSTKKFVFFRIYLFCPYICVCFQVVAFAKEHIWHKALLMGYSMRLEFTYVYSLNVFNWLWVDIEVIFSFS